MELLHARELAVQLMGKHGLIAKGWRFQFDNAKRRAGLCAFHKNFHDTHGTISLSQHFVHLNTEEEVTDTILHEIAHALVDRKHGHDAVWRRKALEIGCDGNRCCGQGVKMPKPKYEAVCPNGHVHRRHKKIYVPVSCASGICAKKFNPQALLVFKLVS